MKKSVVIPDVRKHLELQLNSPPVRTNIKFLYDTGTNANPGGVVVVSLSRVRPTFSYMAASTLQTMISREKNKEKILNTIQSCGKKIPLVIVDRTIEPTEFDVKLVEI